jgi:hypothetical protein
LNLNFRDRSLQALCNSEAALRRRWGRERSRMLAQRLQELDALDCLGEVRHLLHVRVVADEDSGEIAVSVADGLELRVVPSSDSSGGQWDEATEITIAAVLEDARPRSGRKRR